jgi:hypothetical protein
VVPLILVADAAGTISISSKQECDGSVVYRSGSHSYEGTTAVEVIRAIERDETDYPHRGARLRQFLEWSLHRLEARIPLRELFVDVDIQVGDETLAISYLLLLEQYGLGNLEMGAGDWRSGTAAR